MDDHVKDVVRATSRASDEERISFPEVVKALLEAGIERYHADLVHATKTFYLPDGGIEVVHCRKTELPAQDFSGDGIAQALGAIQRGEIRYGEFCRRIAAAGCVGYLVSLAGRNALYYGRANDYHVERFPAAAQKDRGAAPQ